MDAQFFVFRWGVKLCVYHLGMFTVGAGRDQIETTGALPEPAKRTRASSVPVYRLPVPDTRRNRRQVRRMCFYLIDLFIADHLRNLVGGVLDKIFNCNVFK